MFKNYGINIIVFIIFILLELVSKYFNIYLNKEDSYNPLWFVKGAFFITLLVVERKLLLGDLNIRILLFLFLISVTINMFYANSVNEIVKNIKFCGKYLLIFSLILVFIKNLNDKVVKKACVNGFLWTYWIAMLFNVVGLIFDIDFFKTYNELRFGYNGVFFLSNDSVTFWVIAFFFSIVWDSRYHRYLSIGSVLMLLLTGTKSGLLLALGLIGYLIVKNPLSIKIKLVLSIIGIISSVGLLLATNFDFYLALFESNGLLDTFTSLRFSLLINSFEKWTGVPVINKLFGVSNMLAFDVQMDFFNVFFFFGIIGGAIYLFFLIKFILLPLYKMPQSRLFAIVIVLISFWAGHFISSGANTLFLSFVLAYHLSQDQLYEGIH